jgi:type IV secretory pathway protease TraF
MATLRVSPLPGDALAAAVEFHARVLPEVLARLSPPAKEGNLVLVFPPADHAHRAWRLAAVQGLAREYAPLRVNAVASDEEVAIAAACAYLGDAEGVTGQYLSLDSAGAGEVVR